MKLKIFFFLLLINKFCFSQIIIKGEVNDELGNPLPFVNVFIKGTTYGTTTDDDGKFAFSTKKKRGTLEVSFVGFKTQTIKITPKKNTYFKITLKEGADTLDEVVIVTRPKKRLKKKENPAYKILKEVWKRKRKKGLDLVNYYQYKRHETIEVGLNNLDSAFVKNLFKEQFNQAIKEIEYDSDGINYYIPIYLSEQISKVYGNNVSNKIREDIEAEKNDGLGAQGFIFDRMTKTFRDIDIFKNDIVFLRKSFVSPISTDGFATYDYVLHDSITSENEKLYNIYFFPIRESDLAFKGNLWISNKNYAVKKVKMTVNKSVNLNFVRGLTFEKEFDIQNDSIYTPKRNAYAGDFTFLTKDDNNKGLTIKKTEKFTNYILNQKKADIFYDRKKIKIRPDQYQKDSLYWSKTGTADNKKAYSIIKNVKSKRKIKKLTGLINTASSGYLKIGNIQLGPLWTTFGYNEIEGFKTNIGFRTFKTKDDRFRIRARLSYGLKDDKIGKYSASAKYLLSYAPRISTSVAVVNNVQQLGSKLLSTSQLVGSTFGNIALFSRGNNYFLSRVKKVAVNFDYAVHNNLHFGFNFSKSKITSAASAKFFKIDYLDSNNQIQSVVNDVASEIYMSFTPGRNVFGLGVEQEFGRNIFPIILLKYRRGYKDFFNGTHNYDKIQMQYSQPIVLGKLGILDTTIEVGKTFGAVPLVLLNGIPANQSYSLVRNTFALMNYYDYVTDTYAASHFEHHFNGFILNRIPLLNKLKLRSLLTFRAAYGTISDQNININKSSITYVAPSNKLYYEYGVGLENIGYGNLRFLRVDAIWRSNYTPAFNSLSIPTPKFTVRIGIRPGL